MIKSLALALALVIAPSIAAAPAQASAGTSGLAGSVKCLNHAAAGAVVSIEDSTGAFTTATTDSSGKYKATLPAGNYWAAVTSAPCVYYTIYQAVTVNPNRYTVLNFSF